MKLGVSVSAEHTIRCPLDEDLSSRLVRAIHRHTHWTYACTRTEAGYILKPIYRRMPFSHSFMPEITIVESHVEGKTILQMQGRPVDFVRAFMYIWFGGLLMMGILDLAVIPWPDKVAPLAVCAVLGVFGYLLCKLSTKSGFQRVLKAIQRELP
ncbi:MAG: hypothetical protein E7464_06445 [Ruminococcaceae bacterium]|nr:hypothetical protein [Oscillospiraceae bacterium]